MSKRRAPDFNDGESKRQEMENKKYCVRLVIPTKLGGKLIGKGGSVAKALRETHECSINIPNSECPERLVHIRGDKLDGVVNCVQEIGEKLQEEINQIANLKSESYTEIRMLIHQSVCGAIIGRGGETIKKLRAETHTAIRMNGDACPNSTDRVCQIAGDPGNVGAALEAVLDILENAEIKGDERWYDVRNYNGDECRKYGGFAGELGDNRYGGSRPRPADSQPMHAGQQMAAHHSHMMHMQHAGRPDPRGPAPPASWQPPPNYPYPMPQYQAPHGHPHPHYPPAHAHPYSPYSSHPVAAHGHYGAPPPQQYPYHPPPPSGAYAQPPSAGGDYYRNAPTPQRTSYGGFTDQRREPKRSPDHRGFM